MIDFEDIVSSIAKASSLEDLSTLLVDLCKPLGLSHIVYHAVNVPGRPQYDPILLLTYDPSWVGRYFAEEYFHIDPVVACARQAFLPLDWANVDQTSRDNVRSFFRDAERHGVGRQGVTIPIRGPRGERALFTLNCHASDAEWRATKQMNMPQFHIIGHFIHERAMSLGTTRGARPPALSRRELECLHHAAHGKMQKKIAYDLGLSESAVRLYLSSAKHKLQSATLTQAVARAIALELIGAA